MISKTDLAWAAGFIDGEGLLAVYPRKDRPWHRLSIQVTNTDIRPLMKLRAMFGGTVYTSYDTPNPKWNTGYRWQIDHAKAVAVVDHILPYLVNKREQAELLLEFHTYKRNPKHAPVPAHEERKATIVQLLRDLKKNPVGMEDFCSN